MYRTAILLYTTCALLSSTTSVTAGAPNQTLWYNQPAEVWTEALPVGNGRLGAMVYGGTSKERIALNEDTLYTGEPRDYANPQASGVLDPLRQLLLAGQQQEAEKLGNQRFMSVPFAQFPYQPLATLELSFMGHERVTDYQRSLSLEQALATTSYVVDGVTYTREILASYPDDVIAIRLSADQPGRLDFSAAIVAPQGRDASSIATNNSEVHHAGTLVKEYKGKRFKAPVQIETPLRYHTILKALTDGGEVTTANGSLTIQGATSAVLLITAETSYVNYRDVSGDPQALATALMDQAATKAWGELLQQHQADYQALYNRVAISLPSTDQEQLPTDQRLLAATEQDADPGLASLIYQYGRYLMISCSRPGTQPANLQGLWNDKTAPPWGSRYTVNINTQMNYWPAEMTNLAECHYPLLDALLELAQAGQSTAQQHYNARGWVLHHNFDLWRGTAPINAANHGIWTTGGAWLCQHIWWHYEYGEDRAFLEKYYPVMREAAVFFTDFLIEDPRNDKGWLIATPSHSPENGGLVAGATMDHQLIRDLFRNVLQAATILEVDPELCTTIQDMLPRIAPNQIGQHGQLQEWLEDKDNPNNKHRHVSHLWALHPGDEINWQDTPDLFAAAKQSLNFRGDAATGWSMGWKMNFWARLLDGDRAKVIYDNLTTISGVPGEQKGGGLYANLFCAHPPFQIDGNFGATAGITEMIVQNHIVTDAGHRLIHLLPALPSVWAAEGSLSGIRLRGQIEVSLAWQNGAVTEVTLVSKKDQTTTIKIGDTLREIPLEAGIPVTL